MDQQYPGRRSSAVELAGIRNRTIEAILLFGLDGLSETTGLLASPTRKSYN